jgi:Domain of unknown function (DUF955).
MLENKIKKVTDLSFYYNLENNEKSKEKINNELKDILLDLKHQAIKSFKEESDFKNFLDNVCRFNNYSYNNQILIWLQNPNAKYVASFKTFSSMGYKINKDEKSMKILIPSFFKLVKIKLDEINYEIKPYSTLTDKEKEIYKDKNNGYITFFKDKLSRFRIGSVFDASQTNMPLEEINKKLNPIMIDSRSEGIEDVFIKAIYRDGFKVQYLENIESDVKGYCDFENYTIFVKKGLSNLMRLKVVIHEYAHALAHKHLKDNNQSYHEYRSKYETEAESIAYVVSNYLGLDTSHYTIGYLYSWSREKDFKEIDDSLKTIVKFSTKIISNYEEMYSKENLELSPLYGSYEEVQI